MIFHSHSTTIICSNGSKSSVATRSVSSASWRGLAQVALLAAFFARIPVPPSVRCLRVANFVTLEWKEEEGIVTPGAAEY